MSGVGAAKRLLPQRWRLRLWQVRNSFTRETRLVRAAQPSLLERRAASAELDRRVSTLAAAERPVGIDRLDRTWLINLASRPDRLEAVCEEMRRLEMERVERFDAIPHERGAVGCGLSHVACLRRALETSRGCVMVCEDDIVFRLDRPRVDALVDAFLDDLRAEAVCLAYFASRSQPHDRLFLRGMAIRTTACYLVKDRVAVELVELWQRGVAALAADPTARTIDKLWFPLQERRVFVVPIVRAAQQASGHSDVEGRFVTYDH